MAVDTKKPGAIDNMDPEASAGTTPAPVLEQEEEVEGAPSEVETVEKEAPESVDESESDGLKPEKKSPVRDPEYYKMKRDLKRANKRYDELESRLRDFESKALQSSQSEIDRSIKQTEADLQKLKEGKYKALSEGKGPEIIVKIEKAIDDRREMLTELRSQHEDTKKKVSQTPDDKARAIQLKAEELRDEWVDRNPWANATGKEYAHVHVAARGVAEQLTRAGYSAATDEFWEVLDQELHARYPNLSGSATVASVANKPAPQAKVAPAPAKQPASVVSGGSKTASYKSYGLSAERLQFVRERKMTEKEIKEYAESCKEHDKRKIEQKRDRS